MKRTQLKINSLHRLIFAKSRISFAGSGFFFACPLSTAVLIFPFFLRPPVPLKARVIGSKEFYQMRQIKFCCSSILLKMQEDLEFLVPPEVNSGQALWRGIKGVELI